MNLIDKALARLDRDGWTQGGYNVPGTQRCCIYGALYVEAANNDGAEHEVDAVFAHAEPMGYTELAPAFRSLDEDPALLQAVDAVVAEVQRQGYSATGIATFNDDEARTFEEVREVLKPAAERL